MNQSWWVLLEFKGSWDKYVPIYWSDKEADLVRYAKQFNYCAKYLMVAKLSPEEYSLGIISSKTFRLDIFSDYHQRMEGAVSNIHYGGELSKIK